MEYVTDNGKKFTDADIERWAEEAEAGFPNSDIQWVKGRIWEKGTEPMKVKTLRAPQSVWVMTARKAQEAGVSESEWLRRVISRALVS